MRGNTFLLNQRRERALNKDVRIVVRTQAVRLPLTSNPSPSLGPGESNSIGSPCETIVTVCRSPLREHAARRPMQATWR